MIDPAKLLASATRLYGDRMDMLWGAFQPVPADRVTVLKGGERLELAGTAPQGRVHAGARQASRQLSRRADRHRVCRRHRRRARQRRLPDRADAAARHRHRSLAGEPRRRSTRGSRALFLTHFGPSTLVNTHIARLREQLEKQAALVRESLARPATMRTDRRVRHAHPSRCAGSARRSERRRARNGGPIQSVVVGAGEVLEKTDLGTAEAVPSARSRGRT